MTPYEQARQLESNVRAAREDLASAQLELRRAERNVRTHAARVRLHEATARRFAAERLDLTPATRALALGWAEVSAAPEYSLEAWPDVCTCFECSYARADAGGVPRPGSYAEARALVGLPA